MSLLVAAALLCGQFDQQLAIAIAMNTPHEQASIVEPAVPQFVTREVTKYKSVRVKHCNGRQCWYTYEQQPYTVTERVPVEQPTQVSEADEYATPLEAAKRMLEFMRPGGSQTLLDLGSGDGRMVVEWARWTGYPAIGIEIDPQRIAQSRAFAESRGVAHLAKFIEGDFTAMDWPQADVIYLYQFPDVMAAVSERLKSADLVVSFAHAVPGLPMTDHGDFYSWERPKSQTTPAAYWHGKLYTHPVCSNPNCSMCNYLRRAIAAQAAMQ